MNNITIVTAFYNFDKKKHSSSNYYNWIKNYLPNIDANMIIFTDNNSYNFILPFRKNLEHKTKIIILDLEKFYTYKYLDKWNNDILIDHERGYHSIQLYMIWNEKAHFLKYAININPFNTDYFIWTDIGMVREEYYIEHIKTFPNINKFQKKDKVYILNIDNMISDNDYNISIPTEKYRYVNCMGAGVIAGHKDILIDMIDKYYLMLEEFISNNFFAGKDQSIYTNLCIKYKDLFEIIKPIQSPLNNDWFYMLYFFS